MGMTRDTGKGLEVTFANDMSSNCNAKVVYLVIVFSIHMHPYHQMKQFCFPTTTSHIEVQ